MGVREILAVVHIDNQTSVPLLDDSISSIEKRIKNAKICPIERQYEE